MHLRLALAATGARDACVATSTALAIAPRGLEMSRALLADLQAQSRQQCGGFLQLADVIPDTLHSATQYSKVRTDVGPIDVIEITGSVVSELSKVLWEIATNVVKHSAASMLECRVIRDAGQNGWIISLHDDGVGFEPFERNAGWGIRGMNERVRNMGGAIEFESAPMRGTTVRIWLAALGTALPRPRDQTRPN